MGREKQQQQQGRAAAAALWTVSSPLQTSLSFTSRYGVPMSWNSSRLLLLPSHTHTPSFKLAFLLAWILQPKGEEAHSSCKNGFALQEEGEEEEAHGVRMLCFAGEIVGESGSAMVGMPASCNSEGLAALALWNCSGVHPSLWVSILSVCLLLSFFFVRAWEVRHCCSFSFAMLIIVASVWETLPKSCMHREGSVQQWDELQRHRDEEEDAPWELHWGYSIRVTVMFRSLFLLAYGFFFFSAVSPDVNQMLWKTSSCFLMGATVLVAWFSFCLICRTTGFHHWRSLCGQHIL